MNAQLQIARVEISFGPCPLQLSSFATCHGTILDDGPQLTELMSLIASDRFRLVRARYCERDPSISGAFHTRFNSHEHYPAAEAIPEAEWILDAFRDYAEAGGWQASYTTRPLKPKRATGPLVLRAHLMRLPGDDGNIVLFGKRYDAEGKELLPDAGNAAIPH